MKNETGRTSKKYKGRPSKDDQHQGRKTTTDKFAERQIPAEEESVRSCDIGTETMTEKHSSKDQEIP